MKKHFLTFSRIVAVLIPLSLVVGFSPMQSVQDAHPPIHIKGSASSTYQNGYTPSVIQKAYGIDTVSFTGAGQTIAIVDAFGSPTIQNDLLTFDKQFNLPSASLEIAYPEGQPKGTDSNWSLETSLDVEWAHALAPDAKILLVVAKSPSVPDLLKAIDYATSKSAQVVSNSWTTSEMASEKSFDKHFQHTGVVYVASSGDAGAGVEWPAASPYVLSVGGTTLNLDSNGNYLSETAWSGSGGGVSAFEGMPSYQNNWTTIVGSSRGVPDISWEADPNTGVAVYDNGWFDIGGTSVGAPSVSAIIALIDQGRESPIDSFHLLTNLYNLAGTIQDIDYSLYFHDISDGSNGGYSAQPGFDLVTGIGSIKENELIPALIKQ